ncbi:hypothetical protein CYMTET_30048 [Cymbomonas tetramitiformis]|uniref:Uncharacterized protein n=1 Tax=Cymbomonas tetramitiformis TaxID=36881 RepID=A0AAE0FJV9_9CHLO|nr:hypothetical protein CYMTET_30048 [Cymbomonas tetramitiformis]
MQANTHERSSRFEIENDAKSLRTAQMAAQDKALTLNRELEAVRNVNDRLRKNVATVRDEMTNKELMWAEEKEDLLKEVKEAQVQVAKVSQMEEKISEQHAAIQFMEQELQKAELCESEAQAALDRNKKLLVAGEERMQELVLLFGAAKELYSEIQSMGAQHHFLSALRPVGVQGLPNSAIQRFEVNGVPLNKQLRKLPLLKVGLDRPSHPL